MTGKYLRRYEPYNDSDLVVPPAVQGSKLLLRGTPEWDRREQARQKMGCHCLSFGTIGPSGGKVVW